MVSRAMVSPPDWTIRRRCKFLSEGRVLPPKSDDSGLAAIAEGPFGLGVSRGISKMDSLIRDSLSMASAATPESAEKGTQIESSAPTPGEFGSIELERIGKSGPGEMINPPHPDVRARR